MTAFSTVWDTADAKDMGNVPVNTPIAFTSSSTGSVVGGRTQAKLQSDGVNIPTFDGVPHPNWSSVAGHYNIVSLVRVGGSTHWTCGVTVGRILTLPIAPLFQIAPVIVGLPYVGIPLSAINPPTGAPAPTLTYQWKSNGTNISGATASTYQPVSGDVGNVITVTVTGTSTAGTISATTPGTSAIAAHPPDYMTFALGSVDGSTTAAIGTANNWQTAPMNGYASYSCPTGGSGGWSYDLQGASKGLTAAPSTDLYYDATCPVGTPTIYFESGLYADQNSVQGLNATYSVYGNGTSYALSGVSIVNNVASQAGDVVRWRRTMSSTYNPGVDTLQFEVARASNPASFTVLGWTSVASVGKLWPRICAVQNIPSIDAILVKCNGS